MLTKEERAAIAERAASFNGDALRYIDIYKCLIGEYPPKNTSFKEDEKAILDRLIDLCDTSNMVELPIDKDGVPFKIGDTVYESDGTEHKVDGYAFTIDDAKILSMIGSNNKSYVAINPDELTHKKPVTIKSLAQRIKHVLEDEATSIGVNPYVELGRIAEQLESLGDSDD
jgi:hypothetical protein